MFAKKIVDNNVNILSKASEEYFRSHELRIVTNLKMYFQLELIKRISQEIAANPFNRFFGDASIRRSTWDLVETNGSVLKYQLTVAYKSINIVSKYKLQALPNFTQVWFYNSSEGKVIDVEPIKYETVDW